MEILFVFFLGYLLSKLQASARVGPRVKFALVLCAVFIYAVVKPLWTLQSLPATYYTAVGLPRSMKCEEVKSLYRTLAKEKHPDKNQAENSEAEFIEFQKSFDVLGSPTLRTRYELYGLTEEDAMYRDLGQSLPFYIGGLILAYGMTHNKVTRT